MRVAAIIAGILVLFLVSKKNEIKKPETESSITTNVCFEQREFEFAREFENTENTPVFSFKQFSKNDKKRNSESVRRLSDFACKHLLPELKSQTVNTSKLNHLIALNQSQSLLQVFLL